MAALVAPEGGSMGAAGLPRVVIVRRRLAVEACSSGNRAYLGSVSMARFRCPALDSWAALLVGRMRSVAVENVILTDKHSATRVLSDLLGAPGSDCSFWTRTLARWLHLAFPLQPCPLLSLFGAGMWPVKKGGLVEGGKPAVGRVSGAWCLVCLGGPAAVCLAVAQTPAGNVLQWLAMVGMDR